MKSLNSLPKILSLIVVAFFIVLYTNLAFLPGPTSLHGFAHFAYNTSFLVSLFAVLLSPVGVIWLAVEIIRRRKIKVAPLIVVLISIFGYLNSAVFPDLLRDFSREYTIGEAHRLIESIEKYKFDNNEYPDSLPQLIPEYLREILEPSIMGIREFEYTKIDDVFELKFYQNIIFNFNFEVVVYNPKGEHVGCGELPTLHNTSVDNWKYFIFD